jgi:hypothetical protein
MTSPFRSSQELCQTADRRILVVGSGGTGKSSFSVSASAYAGQTMPEPKRVVCKDVALFSGDVDGMRGPLDSGYLVPNIADMSQCKDWGEYEGQLVAAIRAMPKEVRVVVIDLALPFQLIKEHVMPQDVAGWGKVGKLGMQFWRALNSLRNVTLIGNAQLTAGIKPIESDAAAAAAQARAIGGQRTAFAIDAVKSLINPWKENSSFILVRKLTRERDPKTGQWSVKHWTQTQSNEEYEAKSRAKSVLAPVEPGHKTLRCLLDQAYKVDP